MAREKVTAKALEAMIRNELKGTPCEGVALGVHRGLKDGSNWQVFMTHDKATNPCLPHAQRIAERLRALYDAI